MNLIELWLARTGRSLAHVRFVLLAALLVVVAVELSGGLPAGPSGRSLLAVTSLPVMVLAAVAANWLDLRGARQRFRAPLLLVAGVASTLLAMADPDDLATVLPYLIAAMAGIELDPWPALGVAAAIMAPAAIDAAAGGLPAGALWAIAFLPLALFAGMNRRMHRQRIEQADRLVAQTERARAAEGASAALAERARIAREIHDVLAHSLAGLTVQLEAAEALLERGEVERAARSVALARRLAVDGMAETRGALVALREDLPPLPDALRELAGTIPRVRVEVRGSRRGLPAEVSLALYRAAQEALTNVAKHAPGATVRLCLDYGDAAAAGGREVAVTVDNDAPDGRRPALAGAGSGYGLRGIAERAGRLGGSAESGPAGPGWRVRVRLPA